MPPLDGPIPDLQPPAPTGGTAPLAEAFLAERGWLTAVLARRFGPADADDLAQDIFLKLYGYAPPSTLRRPRAFFLRMALNLAANRFHRERRLTPIPANDEDVVQLQALSEAEQSVFFRQMVLALPVKLRDVFLLNRIKKLTFSQIAELKGISVKTVEKRMAQAIVLCVKMLRS